MRPEVPSQTALRCVTPRLVEVRTKRVWTRPVRRVKKFAIPGPRIAPEPASLAVFLAFHVGFPRPRPGPRPVG